MRNRPLLGGEIGCLLLRFGDGLLFVCLNEVAAVSVDGGVLDLHLPGREDGEFTSFGLLVSAAHFNIK